MSNSFAMVVMKMRTNAQSGYFLLLIFTTYAILYTYILATIGPEGKK